MTSDIDLLHRAVSANPNDDAALLALADAYREAGCQAAGAVAELEAKERACRREALADLVAVFENPFGRSDLRAAYQRWRERP